RMRMHAQIGVMGLLAAACLAGTQAIPTSGQGASVSPTAIDVGFSKLYELQFAEARTKFAQWEGTNPNDPLGPAAERASYLFEEFNAQGVLTSEFFLDDDKLFGSKALKTDPTRKTGFESAVSRAQNIAKARLKANANDVDALFSLAITTGMQGDYLSII